MEHVCEKCGAPVEDGVAFCQQCGTPQIRVAGLESPLELSPDEIVDPHPRDDLSLQWSHAVPSAASAGFVAAISMLFPFGAFGLGMLAAGLISVRIYRRRSAAVVFTSGMGARLGAMTGVIGFFFFAIFTAVEVLVFHSGGELHTALLEAVQQSISRTSDPQAQQALEYLKSPPGLALVMTIGLALIFVIFLILTSLGGAFAAAWSRRKHE
jgi:hypothetical protein